MATEYIVFIILIAFIFDFINGFHDAANSIATIVTTGVLTPRMAVMWAAFFNFIAFMVFNLMVAKTIGNGLIDTSVVNADLILSALIGAIFWNLVTWYYGLPSSSSHALVGGLAGAAVARAGFSALVWSGLIKVGIGILAAPLLGIILGYLIMALFKYLTHRYEPQALDKLFKGFQLASSAFLSLTHGGNDAQKTMGVIAVLLFTSSLTGPVFYVPFWVVISCQLVISLGTLTGGWRIVQVMGEHITPLKPIGGCAAETSSAIMIFVATELGIPVSTTHTVTGAIAGTGLIHGLKSLHIPVLKRIFCAWIFTIPAAGLVSAGIMLFLEGR